MYFLPLQIVAVILPRSKERERERLSSLSITHVGFIAPSSLYPPAKLRHSRLHILAHETHFPSLSAFRASLLHLSLIRTLPFSGTAHRKGSTACTCTRQQIRNFLLRFQCDHSRHSIHRATSCVHPLKNLAFQSSWFFCFRGDRYPEGKRKRVPQRGNV